MPCNLLYYTLQMECALSCREPLKEICHLWYAKKCWLRRSTTIFHSISMFEKPQNTQITSGQMKVVSWFRMRFYATESFRKNRQKWGCVNVWEGHEPSSMTERSLSNAKEHSEEFRDQLQSCSQWNQNEYAIEWFHCKRRQSRSVKANNYDSRTSLLII